MLIASVLPSLIDQPEKYFFLVTNYYRILFTFSIFLGISLIKNKKTQTILGTFLIFLLSIVFFQVIIARGVYQSHFDVNMAVSTLLTNKKEAYEMIFIYLPFLLLALVYFIITFICVLKLSADPKNKIRKIIFIVVTFIFCGITIDFILKPNKVRLDKVNGVQYDRFLNKLPFFTLKQYEEAYVILKQSAKIKNQNFHYPKLNITNNNIDNVVIILGESQRRDALSIYNPQLSSTPNLLQRENELLIFDNAIAPASSTVLAVPYMLTIGTPTDTNYNLNFISDNILSLANESKIWNTYWLSTQEKYGKFVSSISYIADNANYKKWKDRQHDENILPLLDEVLKDNNEKRLIIIHINGSHYSAKERYPESFNKIDSAPIQEVNEYLNSVLYTDYILNEIFTKLESTSSIVLYASDHGQALDGTIYRHTLSKKGIDVPFFIWYSNLVSSEYKKLGRIQDTISTTNIYEHTKYFLGIDTGYNKDPNNEFKILTGDLNTVDYNSLIQDY